MSPLILACKEGNLQRVEELLKGGADINEALPTERTLNYTSIARGGIVTRGSMIEDIEIDDRFFTPLHAACYSGSIELVQHLLTSGAKIIGSPAHHTPLSVACGREHTDLVTFLLNHITDHLTGFTTSGSRSDFLQTAINTACAVRNTALVEQLIEFGAPANSEALNTACAHGGHLVVEKLIAYGAPVDRVAFDQACHNGHVEVMELLLKHGVALEEVRPYILSIVCRGGGGAQAIKFAIEKGSSSFTSEKEAFQAFSWAYITENFASMELLYKNVECLKRPEYIGNYLFKTIREGRSDALGRLIDWDVNVNYPDSNGLTALEYACSEGKTNMAEILLKAGAGHTLRDVNGNTLLHRVCKLKQPKIVELLLKYGADRVLENNDKQTPLSLMWDVVGYYQWKAEDLDTIKLLLATQSDIDSDASLLTLFCKHKCQFDDIKPTLSEVVRREKNSIDGHGYTPLMWSALVGNTEMARVLLAAKVFDKFDSNHWQAFHIACIAKNIDIVNMFSNSRVSEVDQLYRSYAVGDIQTLEELFQQESALTGESHHQLDIEQYNFYG